MKIATITSFLESLAHPSLQEVYDNTGLITGNADWECNGVIISLDATEEVVLEAVNKKCNLIVAHHPIIFSGIKKINGKNYVERAVITAIKNDIAIYAIHTNLDNVIKGVSGKMANLLGLQNVTVLESKENTLRKFFTFAPVDKAEQVRNAIFNAGGGHIGNYSECSFNVEGSGTFKPSQGTNPYAGKIDELHQEKEIRIEVIFPSFLESKIVTAMKEAHPYEEVAYDIVSLSNSNQQLGSGIIGDLPEPLDEKIFLGKLKEVFGLKMLRHTALLNKQVKKIALCGGAGSFLIPKALAAEADVYITADLKYHEFFDANGQMLLTDIGHYESEQFTINLLHDVLEQNFPNFALLKTTIETNPVRYF